MYKVLFVCTGNICRSPTAEGVLRHALARHGLDSRVLVDSAGTHGYHTGEAPDMRSIRAADRRGIRIDGLRARQIMPGDFDEFDLILALDSTHMRQMERMASTPRRSELALFLEYAGHPSEREVPDPYYGGPEDFEYVLDLVEAAAEAVAQKLREKL